MRIVTKRIETAKTLLEVSEIIKSFAYVVPKGRFEDNNFVIYCARRYKGGILSLIPIRATIIQQEKKTEICLFLPAGFGFYLGGILIMLGILILLGCLISHSPRWIPGVGAIIIGITVGGQFLREGNALLNRMEHKLLN